MYMLTCLLGGTELGVPKTAARRTSFSGDGRRPVSGVRFAVGDGVMDVSHDAFHSECVDADPEEWRKHKGSL